MALSWLLNVTKGFISILVKRTLSYRHTKFLEKKKGNIYPGSALLRSSVHYQTSKSLDTPPYGTQFFRFRIHFHRKMPTAKVSTPGRRPPSNRKSWIRHCVLWEIQKLTNLILIFAFGSRMTLTLRWPWTWDNFALMIILIP